MIKTSKSIIGGIVGWFRGTYRCEFVADIPDQLVRRTLYVAVDDNVVWLAAMKCPCECGRTIHLNLLQDTRPCWKVFVSNYGYPSLMPSVWRKKDCNSHFFLRNGKIRWV